MTSPIQAANVYTDLQSLDQLKYSSEEKSSETLQFVAQQFEALFLQMMLKSAHETEMEGGLFDGEQTEFYQDWYDKQLSLHLSSGQGIGIAEMMVQQLRGQQTVQSLEDGVAMNRSATPHELPVNNYSAQPYPVPHVSIHSAEKSEAVSQLGSPDEFVKNLWPIAQEAAEKLGVQPEILLAQAALETGWGQKVLKDNHGRSSHNLFNIKADHRWSGDKVSVSTVEYQDGIAVREQARFRMYSSFESSFMDYVSFLKDSPRYQTALSVSEDGGAYTQELAEAGYATDPEYSRKIMGIVNGEPFKQALDAVKI